MERWVERLRIGGWLIATASLAAGAGLWLVFVKQMPPQIPLWYSQPWGESQLARPVDLLILPAMSVGTGVVSGWVAKKLMRYAPLSAMVAATGLVVQAILMLGMLRIVLVIV